jgi:integrase/recombinase XerD
VIIVLLDTGLRAGELVSMDRSMIDWATGAFTVIGKGNKERIGWLGPTALSYLRIYISGRSDEDPALWIGQKGRLTISGVYQLMRRRAEQAGIRQEVRRLIHSTRATFAKHYVQQGGDLESLRKLLGHTTLAMSAYYAQLAGDELADKKNRVNPLGRVIEPPRDQSSRMGPSSPRTSLPEHGPNSAPTPSGED